MPAHDTRALPGSRRRRGRLSAIHITATCLLLAVSPAAEAPNETAAITTLPPYLVTATRMPQDPAQTAAMVDELSTATLTRSPALTLDDTLRGSAAFSLFRRSSSLVANPTAQGVSLRGLGPSGASRSLVLLEGIPLNDPFGGWIAWSKIPQLTLQRAEIVRGGGSGVWGNAALGGTVQLFAPPPEAPGGAITFEAGGFDTVRAEFVANPVSSARTNLQIGGRRFHTDGDWQYAPEQRGSIDRRLDSRHTLGHASISTMLDSGLRLSAGIRSFDEKRGNGTPFQQNESRENAAHARVVGEVRPGFAVDLLAYAQRQHFSSGFSAVDAVRASETPSLDQFDVPATAWGGAIVTTLGESPGAITAIGADLRAVTGETREDFFFSPEGFQRTRFAGGRQVIAGAFAAHQWQPKRGVTTQIATRLDHWTNHDGYRREWIKNTGVVLRDDSFANTQGTVLSPSAGITWNPADGITWRSSAYRAFRVPTLNELHRPFRVGNIATEANPALRRETVTGIETGVALARGAWHARVNVFHNSLHDGVANVTLNTTPTLTQRQRLNLDRIRVRGIEAGLTWEANPGLRLAVDYLYADARVEAASVSQNLVGKRLAQVPRHTATLRLIMRPANAWHVETSARAVSRQFEDDENLLPLAAAVTVNVVARWSVGSGHHLHLAVENLFDSDVETSRANSGLVSFAPGRFARAGWTLYW